jgi:hypothetical protein
VIRSFLSVTVVTDLLDTKNRYSSFDHLDTAQYFHNKESILNTFHKF